MRDTTVTLQEALDLLPDAVIVINDHLKIVTINQHTASVFRYQPVELMGQELCMLLPERFRTKYNRYFSNYFSEPLKRRLNVGSDLFGIRKDGREIDVDIAMAPVMIEGIKYAMVTIRDITKLKDLDRVLLQKNEELCLSNAQLQRFGYVIAHDLKAPLLNVHALVRLLNRELCNTLDPLDKNTKKIEGYLQALRDSSVSMMDLITGVADYSKAYLQESLEEDVDLGQVLQEVEQMVQLPPDFELTHRQPLPVVKGNKTKLLQVFLNLINNAIKYNDKPQGKIEVQAHKNHKVCLINIADNGPGVPVELRRKIFDWFKRGNIDKENSQGIGLAIVKKIIEDRGGGILVDESPWGGADFVFSWPLVKLAEKCPPVPGKKERLIVVDKV
ncbi:sensor histidine kinase [Adhaeribacter soli]|uniref:histidine kinase n=1 Tax=Adhaeribacter soli TaxID=2607655 RepID=A0A5N1INS3_9BACT|nr:ATP-binding protein [Adhaeribacter soli]KAA9331712.1 PAS domain S-box protein [Adhaeribacter soli]